MGGLSWLYCKKTPSLPFAPASPTHRASATVNPERKLYGGGRVRLPWGGEEEEEKPSLSVHWQRPFFGGEGGLGQRGRRSAQKFDEKVAEAEQENRRQRKVSAKKRHANCIQKSSFPSKSSPAFSYTKCDSPFFGSLRK